MDQVLLFLLLGLVPGALYAGIACGLITIYRGTRVVNFAQAGLGMWGAYVYLGLTAEGDLLLPVVGIPHEIDLGGPWSTAPAALLAVATSTVLGGLLYLIVFRQLRKASELARLVASVGVMGALQALIVLNIGTLSQTARRVVPGEQFEIAGFSTSTDTLVIPAIVVALGLAVALWFRCSRTGLAVTASAENEDDVLTLGYSATRLGVISWVTGTTITAVAAVLTVPLLGVSPSSFITPMVPALAVALVAGFSRTGVAIVAGLAFGVIQSELTLAQTTSWYPSWAKAGAKEALAFMVIAIVLFLGGRSFVARGASDGFRLPAAPPPRRPLRLLAVIGGMYVVLLFALEGQYRFGVISSMVSTVMILSLVLITGYLGQLSLAQQALGGVAGFTLSHLAEGAGIPFPIAPLLAAAAASLIGIVFAVSSFRIRGVQFAIVTLAGAVLIEQFLFNNEHFSRGLAGAPVPEPAIGGLQLGVRSGGDFPSVRFGLLTLFVLLVVCLIVQRLRSGETGRAFIAIRSNDRAAASVGVNVGASKLLAFAVASFIAGLAGAFLGYLYGQVSTASFGVAAGLQLIALAYIGGITTIGGAAVGGLMASGGILYAVIQAKVNIGEYYLLVGSVGLVIAAVANPDGIALVTGRQLASLRHLSEHLRARRRAGPRAGPEKGAA